MSDIRDAPTFNLNGGQPALEYTIRNGIFFRTCVSHSVFGTYVGSPSTGHVTMFLQSMEFDYHGADASHLLNIVMIYGGSWALSINPLPHGIFYGTDWQQSFANYHYGSLC